MEEEGVTMEKQTTNINIKLALKINGMTIDEFQKEIEKLYHLLNEMKQLSVLRYEEDDLTNSKSIGISINAEPYIKALKH